MIDKGNNIQFIYDLKYPLFLFLLLLIWLLLSPFRVCSEIVLLFWTLLERFTLKRKGKPGTVMVPQSTTLSRVRWEDDEFQIIWKTLPQRLNKLICKYFSKEREENQLNWVAFSVWMHGAGWPWLAGLCSLGFWSDSVTLLYRGTAVSVLTTSHFEQKPFHAAALSLQFPPQILHPPVRRACSVEVKLLGEGSH